MDIKLGKGLYTWTNRRAGPSHIAARLDCFLVQSSYLLQVPEATSSILPMGISDHRPINLEIKFKSGTHHLQIQSPMDSLPGLSGKSLGCLEQGLFWGRLSSSRKKN